MRFFKQPAFMAALASCTLAVQAADWSINPIGLDLDRNASTGVIMIKSEDKEKINFQVTAMAWTQDADGKDQYTDTQDLVFFPKLMTLGAGEERVIRLGAHAPLQQTEKSYRLFVQELPGLPKTDGRSAQVNFAIRFAAPIFVKPAQPINRAEFQDVTLIGGELKFALKNAGNQHFAVEAINIRGVDKQGAERYAGTLNDRYLLSGTTRRYSMAIPKNLCAGIATLTIELKTRDNVVGAAQKLDVTGAMCA